MTKKQLPQGIGYELVKLEEADSFLWADPDNPVILPNGEFALMPKVTRKTAGEIKEKLILKPEQVSTNAATYQEIATWTVAKKQAILDALLFTSDTPTVTQFKLVIKDDTIFTDKKQQNNLNADIPELDLREGDIVTIYAKSDGATTVLIDGCIQGREIG